MFSYLLQAISNSFSPPYGGEDSFQLLISPLSQIDSSVVLECLNYTLLLLRNFNTMA